MGELLKYMDYPGWIKNGDGEFIFYNKEFKKNILVHENNDDVKKFLRKIKEKKENTSETIMLNNNLYKYFTYSYDGGKYIMGVLIEASELKESISHVGSSKSCILHTLKKNLQNKHAETCEHTSRVSDYCLEIGKVLNLDENMLEKAIIIGMLHDVGKIWISDKILLKPGKLTDEEYEIMKTHSEKGYKVVELLPEINCVSKEILAHHERWDGKGYPLGLEKDEIPILSRIVSVADSFDAMTSDRCYSKAKSIEDAVHELKRCSGTQFDPNIVKVFVSIINNMALT